MLKPKKRAPSIGIALGSEQVTAVLPDSTIVTVPCSLSPDGDAIENFAVVLLELRAQLSALTGLTFERAHVDVALLPPLVDTRLIVLPPLRQAEAEAVIRRDAARHFVGSNIARALAVQLPAQSSGPAPVLASAATSTLLEQIRSTFHQLGWQAGTIAPAVSAWLAAVKHAAGADRSPRVVVAQVGDTVHVIRLEGSPVQLRRVPLVLGEELQDAVGTGAGRPFIFAGDAERALLERVLASAGWQIASAVSSGPAAAVAAQFARHSEVKLEPASVALERKQQQRTMARRFAIAAPLLLLAAGTVELWGARRELSSVRARRAEIRAEIAPLLATRDSIANLERRLKQISGLQAVAPRWTAALFDLAMLLPADTHLRSLHATGDTLVIEALGSRAGETLQVLRSAPSLRDVRLKGQVERDLEGGETTVERFTLQARLAPHDSLPAQTTEPGAARSTAARSQ